jgi:DNA-binding response OmpR family regulator
VLPPAPDDAGQSAPHPAGGLAHSGALEHRVLVVEDEPEIAAQIAVKLGYEGLYVRTANTGAAALALAQAEPFDLIALDVLLPDMQGGGCSASRPTRTRRRSR